VAGINAMAERRVVDSAPEGPARDALSALDKVRAYQGAAERTISALGRLTDSPTASSDTVASTEISVKRATFAVAAQPVAVSEPEFAQAQ
jgi:hypothetical protein